MTAAILTLLVVTVAVQSVAIVQLWRRKPDSPSWQLQTPNRPPGSTKPPTNLGLYL